MGEDARWNFFQFVVRQSQGIQISQTCNRGKKFSDGSSMQYNMSLTCDSLNAYLRNRLLGFQLCGFRGFPVFSTCPRLIEPFVVSMLECCRRDLIFSVS